MIGEGGSGGALAVGVGDRVLMLQIQHLLGDLAGRLRAILAEKCRQGPDAAEARTTADKLQSST